MDAWEWAPPQCPVHKTPMRPSRYSNGWYCPNKVDGAWCDGQDHTKPAPYVCNECGAALYRAYCPACKDPEMVVAVKTGQPDPPPFGQSGLDEDHYGHG